MSTNGIYDFTCRTNSLKAAEGDLPANFYTFMGEKFPDEEFRNAVIAAVEEFYDDIEKSEWPMTPEGFLSNFYGTIKVGTSSDPSNVASIEGIEYLSHADANITIYSNKLEDISYAYSDSSKRIGTLILRGPIHIYPAYDTRTSNDNTYGNFYWATETNTSFTQQYGQKASVKYLYKYGGDKKVILDTEIMAGEEYILDKRTNITEENEYIQKNELTDDENISLDSNRYVVIDKIANEGEFDSLFYYYVNLISQRLGSDTTPNRYSFSYHYSVESEYVYSVKLITKTATGLDTLEFTKTDSVGNPLKGAKFVIYSDEDLTQIAQQYTVKDGVLQSPTNVPEQTSDKDGKIKVEGLKPGTYYIEETYVPDGYEDVDNPIAKVILTELDTDEVVQSLGGGEGTSITINEDVTTFEPTWEYKTSTYASTLYRNTMTTEDTKDISASDVNVDFFIKNEGEDITYTDSLEDVTALVEPVYTVSYVGGTSALTTVNSLEDAVDYVNGLIEDGNVTDNIVIEMTSAGIYNNENSLDSEDPLVIENKESDVTVNFCFKKVFKNGKLMGNDFTFALYEGEEITGEPKETVKNDSEGVVMFDTIEYEGDPEKPTTFYYCVKEVLPDVLDEDVVYDTDVRHVKVVVSKSTAAKNYQMQAQIYVENKLVDTVYSSDEDVDIYLDSIRNRLKVDLPIPPTCVK